MFDNTKKIQASPNLSSPPRRAVNMYTIISFNYGGVSKTVSDENILYSSSPPPLIRFTQRVFLKLRKHQPEQFV